MQTYDIFSMWITDDIVSSLHEATLEATGSIDASRKFLQSGKAKMGILTNFYYTEQSANAALISGQHKFVNLVAVHPPESLCEPVAEDDPMVQDNIVYVEEDIVSNEELEETLDDNGSDDGTPPLQ
jgi:hypothetical protein